MHFTKMHGLGNDYLYVLGEVPKNVSELSVKYSERHFGAGSDGIIYISPSKVADFKMRIFNADGSEAKMCGNGIRCVGKYVYDKGLTDKTELTIETLSGIKSLSLQTVYGKVKSVSVDMGYAESSNDLTIEVLDKVWTFTPVSVGNPHAVTFVDNMLDTSVETVGKIVEKDEHFPGGVNVELVQVLDDKTIKMRVWERGSAETLACGTGACAVAVAACLNGFADYNTEITVHLLGGDLYITCYDDLTVTMKGEAQTVFYGEYLV